MLQSNPHNSNVQALTIFLATCVGSGCASPTEISNYLNLTWFNIFYLNSYYDGSDSQNPIKQYLTTDSINLDANDYVRANLDVVPTEVKFINGTTKTICRTGVLKKDTA